MCLSSLLTESKNNTPQMSVSRKNLKGVVVVVDLLGYMGDLQNPREQSTEGPCKGLEPETAKPAGSEMLPVNLWVPELSSPLTSALSGLLSSADSLSLLWVQKEG